MRHVLNAHTRETRYGLVLRKDRAASPTKIDAAVAAILAWQARADVLLEPAPPGAANLNDRAVLERLPHAVVNQATKPFVVLTEILRDVDRHRDFALVGGVGHLRVMVPDRIRGDLLHGRGVRSACWRRSG